MAIAAGVAGVLVIGSAMAMCGGGGDDKRPQVAASGTSNGKTKTTDRAARVDDKPATPAAGETDRASGSDASEDAERRAADPTREPDDTSAGAGSSADGLGPTAEELAAAEAVTDDTASDATTTTTGTTGTTGSTDRPRGTTQRRVAATGTAKTGADGTGKKLGGKQVVLEYDQQARDNKPVATAPKSDQGAIQKARAAYATGNQRLFAGDSAGAITFYKQSIAHYPGYVAGYRGLGLAYAQRGDKAKALQALRTYLSSVPGAKDAPLIRKRVSTLQGK